MRKTPLRLLLAFASCAAATATVGAGTALAGGGTSVVPIAGTGTPETGSFTPSGTSDATQVEFPGEVDSDVGPASFQGTITDRSLSRGNGKGVSVNGVGKGKPTLTVKTDFEGLNFYQQRYARGGNQFSLEPPDQGLCAGNGFELEVVNDVLNVYDSSGKSVLPDNTATNIVGGHPRNVNHAVDLNSFLGYQPAINRATGVFGPEPTDPSCLFDAATQRWFVAVLTLERVPATGALTLVNHIDIAVSKTADPTGDWNLYKTDITSDGSNPDPANACPCVGDYPHIGADANGFYVTTNAYPWLANGFDGAQIYAFSKAQLAAGAFAVAMQHIDTFAGGVGVVKAGNEEGETTQPGFTVWPAQSPGDHFQTDNGGTEYLLSSNAADEAQFPVAGSGGDHTSTQLVLWTLANTSSLNTTPALGLSAKVLSVNQYAIPPAQTQPGSGTAPGTDAPQGHCLNDETTSLITGATGCWHLLVTPAKHARGTEVIVSPDSNDTRMQQVMYANGKVWGALDTALNPDGGGQRAGIAYYVLNPAAGNVMLQGYLGAAAHDFTYPAIGVTNNGRGVIAFTDTGGSTYPSAAYAPLTAAGGAGAWSDIAPGAAVDDGFSGYKQQGPPVRSRWGDYGAAAVDGSSIWIASEYIAHACNYATWGGPFFTGGTGDNLLGTCAASSSVPGTRAALGNWSTRISELTP